MQQSCSVCFNKFNNYLNAPLSICRQQHLICFSCKLTIGQKNGDPKCPFCRANIPSKNIFGNKLFQQCDKRVGELNEKCQIEKERSDFEFVDAINDLLSFKTKDNSEILNDDPYFSVVKMIQSLSYRLAKILLKRFIQEYPNNVQDQIFDGLGSKAEIQFYGRSDCADYWNRYYMHRSLCDQLAICCLFDSSYKEDKEWYKQMIEKHPSLYQIRFGLALLEHNEGNKAQAQKLYEQVIEMEESCDKAYQMLAFLHFPSKQSKQYALQSLIITDKFNVFIDYFLAMCGQGDKMQLLTELVNQYPCYMQPYYNLCRLKELQGNQSQAFAGYLIYLDSCMNISRLTHFFSLLDFLSACKSQKEQKQVIPHKPFGCGKKSLYKQTLPLLLKMLERYERSLDQGTLEKIIFWIGKCYVRIDNARLASKWLKIFSRNTTCPIDYLELWIEMYFQRTQYNQVITTFETNIKNIISFSSYGILAKKRIVLSYVEIGKYDFAIQLAEKDYQQNKKCIRINLLEEVKKRRQLKKLRNSYLDLQYMLSYQ